MSGRGNGWELVEADAGYVGGLDDVGVIVALFGEGDGEVLDLVFDTEFHKELDEVSEVFDVVVIAFVGLDVAQADSLVRKMSTYLLRCPSPMLGFPQHSTSQRSLNVPLLRAKLSTLVLWSKIIRSLSLPLSALPLNFHYLAGIQYPRKPAKPGSATNQRRPGPRHVSGCDAKPINR